MKRAGSASKTSAPDASLLFVHAEGLFHDDHEKLMDSFSSDDGVRLRSGETLVDQDIALRRGFQLSGRVVDENGAGIDGATLEFSSNKSVKMMFSMFGIESSTSTSGQDGSFVVTGVPQDDEIKLRPTHAAYPGTDRDRSIHSKRKR